MTLLLKNKSKIYAQIIKYCKNDFSEDEEENYPVIIENKICSYAKDDRRRNFLNGKEGITMTHKDMVRIKDIVGKTFNKDIFCFAIYIFQNMTVNNEDLYKFMLTNVIQSPLRNFCETLCKYLNEKDVDKIIALLNKINNQDLEEKPVVESKVEKSKVEPKVKKSKVEQLYTQFIDEDYSFSAKEFFIVKEKSKRIESVYYKLKENNENELMKKVLNMSGCNDYSDFFKYYHEIPQIMTFKEFLTILKTLNTKYFDILKEIQNKTWNFTILDYFINIDKKTNIIGLTLHKEINKAGKVIISNIYELFTQKGLIDIQYASQKMRIIQIINILDLYNPGKCIHRKEELIMMTPFNDYLFKDLDKFINLRGHCFSHLDIAQNIVSNKGVIVLPDIVLITSEIHQIIIALGNYFDKNKLELKEDIDDLLNTLKSSTYTDDERELFYKDLAIPKNFTKVNNWTNFFKYIVYKFREKTVAINVKKIYNYSCNTLFELIGLYGYMCLSDDITVFENTGSKFITALFCTTEIINVFDKIKRNIPELWTDLENISFNNTTLKELLSEIETTCIHGVGLAFMKYYISAYESALSVKKQIGGNKLKPIPDSITDSTVIDEMFRLAPYLIEVPEKLKKNSLNIKYLTCIHFNESLDGLLRRNPLNEQYLIFGIRSDHTHLKIMYLNCNQYNNLNNYTELDQYFTTNNNTAPRFTAAPITNGTGQDIIDYYNNVNNQKYVLNLLNISYTFRKQKKPTFKVFADYTYNMCCLMTAVDNPHYKALSDAANEKMYDFITLEETQHIPKYMTVIKIDGETYKDAHMWNSVSNYKDLKKNKNKYYIDTLQNFVTLPYTYDNNKAIVKTPTTMEDVTKQYQVSQLLAKVLLKNNSKIKIGISQEEIQIQFKYFESYYNILHGQDINFRSIIFKNIVYKDDPSLSQKIDGITICDYYDKLKARDLAIVNARMMLVSFLIVEFYTIYLPGASQYYNRIKRYHIKPIVENNAILLNYVAGLNNLVVSVCGEGTQVPESQYHFTELSKEYYLLYDISKEYKKDSINLNFIPTNQLNSNGEALSDEDISKTTNQINITKMIKILNKKYSYFEDNDLKLIKCDKENAYTESIPRAIEYIIKIGILDAQSLRMTEYLLFERILEYVIDHPIEWSLITMRSMGTVELINRLQDLIW